MRPDIFAARPFRCANGRGGPKEGCGKALSTRFGAWFSVAEHSPEGTLVPALRNEIEDTRHLLVAAEKRLRETILKIHDSPSCGRLIQEHWTVSQMLGRHHGCFSQAG